MATFWKGFAIFWIIFLIWYLTGGPQRTNSDSPITTFNSSVTDVTSSTQDGNPVISNIPSATESSSNSQSNIESKKSFSSKPKINTINFSD